MQILPVTRHGLFRASNFLRVNVMDEFWMGAVCWQLCVMPWFCPDVQTCKQYGGERMLKFRLVSERK